MALRKGAYQPEEREKKSSQSLGNTLILKKMLGIEQQEKDGRNTYNRFYNTGDEENQKGSAQRVYDDIRNNKIESKFVLHQNQIRLIDEDSYTRQLPHAFIKQINTEEEQLKQSRPHLPKNANITGNLMSSQFELQNKEPYIFPPDFHKKIKLTQDQIRAPTFYNSNEESPDVSQKSNNEQAANESEECVQRIASYSLNTSQNLKGKMFYQTQILNGKKVQDNHYQDNKIYENKPIVRGKKISSSHRNHENIYGNRLESLNQSQDLGSNMNILSGGATLHNQKGLSKSNMSNYGQQTNAQSGNPSIGRANQGKQFFIGMQKRQQQNFPQQQNNQKQIVLRMQAQSQMSSYNLGKTQTSRPAGQNNHYQNKGQSQKKQGQNREIELMNASAPLNMHNIKQGASFDGHNHKVPQSQSIQNFTVEKKIPNNSKVINTMGTLNATDIYNINQNKIARSTQNQQRIAMGRTDKNQIYLNMNLQQQKVNDDQNKQLYYNKKAQKMAPKNQRINRPQSSQQMNSANLNEVQLKQMKQLQQIQQMQLNNSQVQIGIKQSSIQQLGDLENSMNRPKSMLNSSKNTLAKKQAENVIKKEKKLSNSLENLRNQANNDYLPKKQLCSIRPQKIIKKPIAQKVTIVETELQQPLTNLNFGSFEANRFEPSENDTGPKIKKNIKLNPMVKKPSEKSNRKRTVQSDKERVDSLQSTMLIKKTDKIKIHHEIADNLIIKIDEVHDQDQDQDQDESERSIQFSKQHNKEAFDKNFRLQQKIKAQQFQDQQYKIKQTINEGQDAIAQVRSQSSISEFRDKKTLNMTQPAGIYSNNELEDQYLLFQQGTMPHDEYQDFTDQHFDQSDGYFKITNAFNIISPVNEIENTNGKNLNIEKKKKLSGTGQIDTRLDRKRRSSDAAKTNEKQSRPQSIGQKQNIFYGGQTIPLAENVSNIRLVEKPPQSHKSVNSQGQSQGRKKRSNSRQGGFTLPNQNPAAQKKGRINPSIAGGQITQTNKAQNLQQNKKKIVQNEINTAKLQPQTQNNDGKVNVKQIQNSNSNRGVFQILTNPQNSNQTTQKKFKIQNQKLTQMVVDNQKKDQKQMINTLLNFYASKQKDQLPLQKKQMLTQKINIKEMFSKQPINNHMVVNEAYLKGARNSSLNATIKSNKQKVVRNRVSSSIIHKKNPSNDIRASSENKHKKTNLKFLQQTQTNIGDSILAIDDKMNQQVKNYLNLTQNLKNVNGYNKGYSAEATAKINFLSTLKGGQGIMNNLSNNQQDSQLDNVIDGGEIMQINDVLNQLNNQNNLELGHLDKKFINCSNAFDQCYNYEDNNEDFEKEDEEQEEEEEEAEDEEQVDEDEQIANEQDVYGMKKKKLNLNLKDCQRGSNLLDSFTKGVETESEKRKKQNYITQLQEDLEEKLKERYAYANEQIHNQSNNQILAGTETSAQDHNSSVGGKSSQDNSNNRVHNYIFGKQIGEGAYAVVRIATSREDNQKYAIKIYDKTKLNDINRQRSVRREVVLLQKMNHEHVVKLIEAFETDSHVYLVMENVSGGSLHSYLKEVINKQLDEEEARRIFQQILIALKYCHSKSIAHRDIKLENILLDENKNVKLIDFGFSTCIPNHKKIRMFCGTPSYMAPQIVSKVEYSGPPADIWASGVLLYALLNGCFPFRGQTDDDLYRRIKRGTYQIHNQKVSREYLDILQRCLDINDDTRATAADLLDDQWFKIKDIRQRAYDEEKRAFKARILAKVPIIKKTNHTICILAGQPNHIQKESGDNNTNQGIIKTCETNAGNSAGSVGSNSGSYQAKQTPEQKQKFKKVNGIQGLTIINQNEKHILQVNHNNIGNFPYTNNQNPNKCELIISDYGLHQGTGANDKQQSNENNPSGGAILLSYGAAVAPQIQINNINNLNLISQNMKKKLNHEAYQAYYNTSSANTAANCGINIQSSPIAQVSSGQNGVGGQINGQINQNAASGQLNSSEVYGQPQTNYVPQQPTSGNIQQQQTNGGGDPSSLVDSGRNSIPSNSQTDQPKLRQQRSSGHSSQELINHIASDQSSPYGSAYHHNLINNQMAQLQQLQQEVIQERQQQQRHQNNN